MIIPFPYTADACMYRSIELSSSYRLISSIVYRRMSLVSDEMKYIVLIQIAHKVQFLKVRTKTMRLDLSLLQSQLDF